MPRHLRLRVGLVLVVVAASVWYLYPLRSSINLGLDLQGGIHLMLGVEADRHVASQTDRAAEDLKSALERKGIAVTRIARDGNTAIQIELASPQSWNDARTVVAEFATFERRDDDQAAGRFRLVMTDRYIRQLRDEAVRQGLETIRNRIDQFGVSEPTITRQGADQILIQLPGVQDPARAKALIGKTALLEFKLLDERTSPEQAQAGQLPDGSELLYERPCGRDKKDGKSEVKKPVVVQKRTLLTGSELTDARVTADPNAMGNWQVSITFTATGGRIFGEVTEQNVGRRLAIILDNTVCSSPRINERIPGGHAVITGQFYADAARGHRGRIPARAADDRRHAPHRHGNRGHPPVVRDQLGEGLRGLAVHRPGREPLHGLLLHAPPVRPPVHGPAEGGDDLDMIELFRNPNYDFIGKRKWAYIISIAFTLISLGTLVVRRGLRYDLDFTGGTLIQVRFEQPPSIVKIRASLATIQLGESIIQEFGDNREYIIRLPLVEGVCSQAVSRRGQGA